MVQSRELGGRIADEHIAHGRGQMGNGGAIFSHPLGKLLMLNVLLGGDQQLSTEEQRGEDVSLNGIMGCLMSMRRT